MNRTGFIYNMNTCLGCGNCQVACKQSHGLRDGEFFRRVTMLKSGPFSGGCNHCRDAACVKACPVGAMYRAEERNHPPRRRKMHRLRVMYVELSLRSRFIQSYKRSHSKM